MRSLVKALAVVLAVPAVCAALALTSRSELDDRWQATLRRPFLMRRQMPDERVIARYSLAARCGDARFAAGVRPCRPYKLLSSTATAAEATGALGVAFLAAIVAAGAASRSRSDRLARLFRPALYATVVGLVLLVLVHGALGVASVFLLGEGIQRWPLAMVLFLAAAAAAATVAMMRLAITVTRQEGPSVVARALRPETQPRLADWVCEAAAAVGARAPEHLLAGLRPVLFATDAAVVCLDGRVVGRALHLPLPLARILSVEEMRGLIVHELAHLRAGGAEDTSRLVRLHAGVRRSMRTLAGQAFGIRAVTTLPAMSVLSVFMEAFEPGVAAVNRDREAAADRVAAALVGPKTFAAALMKVHALTPAWEPVSTAMHHAAAEKTQYINASALFAEVASASAGTERLAGAGDLALPHPIDVHQSLAGRLEALGVGPGDLAPAGLATPPPEPAIRLLERYEMLERDLSEVEHRIAASVLARFEDQESPQAAA